MDETIDNVGAAGKYPLMLAITRRSQRALIAPEQTRHGRVVPPAPRGRIPSHLSPRDRMRRNTLCGCKLWSRIRPDQAGPGIPEFLLRGLEKVKMVADLNLLKLFRFGVNLHRKARVDGPAQRIRNAEVVSRRYSQSYLGAGRGNRQN